MDPLDRFRRPTFSLDLHSARMYPLRAKRRRTLILKRLCKLLCLIVLLATLWCWLVRSPAGLDSAQLPTLN